MNDFEKEQQRAQVRQMEAVLPDVQRELGRFANVEAITIGAKEINGVATTQAAFQVYVRVKKKSVELPPDERIPPELRGFPTDVILIEDTSRTEDTAGYRPLAGGTQLNGNGTLGIIAVTTAGGTTPAGTPVILTNSHVAPTVGAHLGQPGSASDCGCCVCCDVGVVVASTITPTVDGAIATLNSDVRFTTEIVEIGAVRGWATGTTMHFGDVVFKRGRTTELVEGRFSSAVGSNFRPDDNKTFVNQIRVTSPPPVPPATTQAPFQLKGDSGSVLLDSQQRVIGLVHSAVLPAGTPAFASRIEDVRATLNIDIPLMGTAGAIPLSAAAVKHHDLLPEDIRRLAAVYGQREAGKRWWELVQRHQHEVMQLVNNNRATMTAWNRHHGPSFVSHYLKTIKDHGYHAPQEINGIRVENLLLAIATVLQDEGNPALAHAIWQHYLQIIEAVQGRRTVDAFIDHLTQSFPAADTTESEPEDCAASLVNH